MSTQEPESQCATCVCNPQNCVGNPEKAEHCRCRAYVNGFIVIGEKEGVGSKGEGFTHIKVRRLKDGV